MVSVCLPSDALLQHLPSYLGFSYLGRGVSLHGRSSKAQPLFLTLDEGYLLSRRSWPSTWDSSSRPSCACEATAPWVAPPRRRPGPWAWVAPPSCRPWPQARGGSSRSPPLASAARWFLPAAPDLGRGESPPGRHWPLTLGSSSQPPPWPQTRGVSSWLPLTSDAGWLLPAVPAPSQPGTLSRCPWLRMRGSSPPHLVLWPAAAACA